MLSEFIKEKTAHWHDLAEQKFRSKKIFEKGYSVDDYKYFMAENYRTVSKLEPIIEKFLPKDFAGEINFNERKKLNAITKDAEFLGLKIESESELELPSNGFEAIGMLYVLEGASLGGNMIKKQLQRTLGFEQIEFNYLGIYAENIGKNWAKFVEVLNRIPNENYFDVLNGAEKAYKFLVE